MPNYLSEITSFTAGLITESTPLNAPENSCTVLENFKLGVDGSVEKRQGLTHATPVYGFAGANAIEGHKAALTGATGVFKGCVPLQTGSNTRMLLYRADQPEQLVVTTVSEVTTECDVAPVLDGFVYISNNVVRYLPADGTASTIVGKIKVRDVWGVDDGLDLNTRPTTLTDAHKYNMFNQGWPINTSGFAYTEYQKFDVKGKNTAATTHFPANSDTFALSSYPTSPTQKMTFDAAAAAANNIYYTEAPKGKVIIELRERGTLRVIETNAVVSGTNLNLPADTSTGSYTAVAAYAGRVWYAGADGGVTDGDSRSPKLNQTIAFTQVVSNTDDLIKCYQKNDPTDPDTSDLLPTDGGVIEIPGVGKIQKLLPIDNGLLVVASNSIRFITGPDGVFRADDFSIDLVADIGTSNRAGIINLDNGIMFANEQGLYAVMPNEQGRLAVQNLTNTTIKTWYLNMLDGDITRLVGSVYDTANREVRWMFHPDTQYAYELIFNLDLRAFYTYKYDTTTEVSQRMRGYVPLQGQERSYYIAGDTGSEVWMLYHGFDDNVTKWRDYFRLYNDYTATLVTGSTTVGSASNDKWLPYITSHFERTETGFYDDGGGQLLPKYESECTLRARWNFADTAASGKFGSTQQAYRYPRLYVPVDVNDTYDWGESVISTKLRIRGSGKALQLEYHSPIRKGCTLYGWGMLLYGTGAV